MLRTVSALQEFASPERHCVTAGGAVQDGWTFLDVRPPHEIAKVHPAAGWVLARATHAPATFAQLSHRPHRPRQQAAEKAKL